MTEALSPDQARGLAVVSGMMIPASARHGVPGADDALIQVDLLRSLGRDADALRSALSRLDTLAGGAFADQPAAARTRAVEAFQAEGGTALALLNRLVLQAYYRDDRVMRALGMEPRAPFPKGHVVEQGDWALLDAVRKREPLWRPDR